MQPLADSTGSLEQLDVLSECGMDAGGSAALKSMVEHDFRFGAAVPGMSSADEVAPIAGVRIGILVALSAGLPLVDFSGNPFASSMSAQSAIRLTSAHLQRRVVLMFEDGSPERPVIIGLVQQPVEELLDAVPSPQDFGVETDGRRVVISAEEELVLRCGRASITLTKAGKVLIRGAYLSSRSSGVNRIKGSSVQIN